MPIQLFPNWIVKLVRQPNLQTKFWLYRPVEVFHVSPKMTKFEIKEYLIKLYNMPVSHVHTAIYQGKKRINRNSMKYFKEPDYKKAYVYLSDAEGANQPRYTPVEAQLQEEWQASWPVLPHRDIPDLPKKSERTADMYWGKDRHAVRMKKLHFKPYDSPFPPDMKPNE